MMNVVTEQKGEITAPPWGDISDHAEISDYRRGYIPVGFPLLTCGVDPQGDRVEWQVVAWGPNRRRAVVEYGVYSGHISEKGCQERLDDLLNKRFPNVSGRTVQIDMLAIDGNAYTEDVWEWSKKHPVSKVIMVRSVASEFAPILQRAERIPWNHDDGPNPYPWQRRLYNFGSSFLKMVLYRNLVKIDPEEQGFIAMPIGFEDEYFRQLTSESRKSQRTITGFTSYLWVKDPNRANEALDTHLRAEAAAIRLDIRNLPDSEWDRLMAERECAPLF